jgi:hypothetical protein
MANVVRIGEKVGEDTCREFQQARGLHFFAQKILRETLRECRHEKRILRGTTSRGG